MHQAGTFKPNSGTGVCSGSCPANTMSAAGSVSMQDCLCNNRVTYTICLYCTSQRRIGINRHVTHLSEVDPTTVEYCSSKQMVQCIMIEPFATLNFLDSQKEHVIPSCSVSRPSARSFVYILCLSAVTSFPYFTCMTISIPIRSQKIFKLVEPCYPYRAICIENCAFFIPRWIVIVHARCIAIVTLNFTTISVINPEMVYLYCRFMTVRSPVKNVTGGDTCR